MSLIDANGKAIADILAKLAELEQKRAMALASAVAWHTVAGIGDSRIQEAAARRLAEKLADAETTGDIDKHGPELAAILAKGRSMRAAARHKRQIQSHGDALHAL